jgi:hypothetical protein
VYLSGHTPRLSGKLQDVPIGDAPISMYILINVQLEESSEEENFVLNRVPIGRFLSYLSG